MKNDERIILLFDSYEETIRDYRLLFEPAHDPLPRKPDGGLDWAGVTAIRILGVEDYHG